MCTNTPSSYEYVSNETLLAKILGVKEECIKGNFSFGNYNLRMSNLKDFDYSNEQMADKLEALLTLYRRVYSKECRESKVSVITCPQDAAALVMSVFKEHGLDPDKEHFMMISLNVKNHVNAVDVISIGSQTASVVHQREVFMSAIKNKAVSIILAHNHPSGDPTASKDDIRLTKIIKDAGKILDIYVMDHVIFDVRKHTFESMAEQGTI